MSGPPKHLFARVAFFGLAVNLFFIWLGNSIPQLRKEAPRDLSFADLSGKTGEELAAIGKEIFNGKGTCFTCHAIGEGFANRCPNLGAKNGLSAIGPRAQARLEEGENGRRNKTPDEYLAESLYIPAAYVVKEFPPIMPPANKPPLALTDAEIVTLVAFLQNQGGRVTVSPETRYDGVLARIPKPVVIDDSKEQAALAELSPKADLARGEALYKANCLTCHGEKGDGKGPGGSALSPPPRDFTDAVKMKEIPRLRMFKVVKYGGAANGLSALMASFQSTLSDQEIVDVLTFARRFAFPDPAQDPDTGSGAAEAAH